jgi:hypothetical protein
MRRVCCTFNIEGVSNVLPRKDFEKAIQVVQIAITSVLTALLISLLNALLYQNYTPCTLYIQAPRKGIIKKEHEACYVQPLI